MINCEFEVHGQINSPHGTIIGGRSIVTGAVKVVALGSPASVATELVIGTVPWLDPFAAQLNPYVDDFQEKHQGMAKEQAILEKESQRLTAQDKKCQTELMFEIMNINENMDKAQTVYEAINRRIDEHRMVDVEVSSMLHAGVLLNVNGRVYRVNSDVRGPIRVHLDDHNEVVYTKGEFGGGLLSQIAMSWAARHRV